MSLSIGHYVHIGSRRCTCGNCDWSGTEKDIEVPATFELDRDQYANDLHDRLSAGAEVPVGDCPECGALAYLDTPYTRARDQAERMYELLKLVVKQSELPPLLADDIENVIKAIERP